MSGWPSWDSVVFVCWTSPLQDETPVCHDCLVANATSKFIINISSRHGCSGVNVWSPAGNCNKSVLTYGHSPGPLNTISRFEIIIEGLQAFTGIAGNGNRGMSSEEQGLRNKLRERIGLLKRFVYCNC